MIYRFKEFCGKNIMIYESVFDLYDAIRVHEELETIIPHINEGNMWNAFEYSMMHGYYQILEYIFKKFKKIKVLISSKEESIKTHMSGLIFSTSTHINSEDKIKTVDFLLKNNIITYLLDSGFLLIQAVSAEQIELIEYLLNNGADINKTCSHNTPLQAACRLGFIEIVELLLKYNPIITEPTIENIKPGSEIKRVIFKYLFKQFEDNPATVFKYREIFHMFPKLIRDEYEHLLEIDDYNK